MPPGDGGVFPGCSKEQLIQLETEVYGLVSGPAWWRKSFLQVLVKECGYRINSYDRCVLTLDAEPPDLKPLPGTTSTSSPTGTSASSTSPTSRSTTSLGEGKPGERTQGLIVIEIDDVLEAGNAEHRRRMEWLEKRLRFGKAVNLQEEKSGTGYAGRRLRQLENYSFELTMADYIKNRLKPVVFQRKFLVKNAKSIQLTDEEESALRGTVASVNWCAREGRPDAAAAASVFSGVFPNPSIADALEVNKIVAKLKEIDVVIRIHPIKEELIRHVLISDSSFDPTGKTKPQHGWLQGVTTPQLNRGEEAPISLISWKSRRLRRKAGSLEKQMATLNSFLKSNYSVRDELERMDDGGLRGTPTVIAEEDQNFQDPKSVAILDSKGVFDASSNEQSQGECDRTSLEVALIRDSMSRTCSRIRWVPHNRNPADMLTKVSQAHETPMYDLLRTSKYRLQVEAEVLESGRQSDQRMKQKHSQKKNNEADEELNSVEML